MITFKEFLDLLEDGGMGAGGMGSGGVPVNNIAGSGAKAIAKYDPLLGKKMFRRKKKIHELSSQLMYRYHAAVKKRGEHVNPTPKRAKGRENANNVIRKNMMKYSGAALAASYAVPGRYHGD